MKNAITIETHRLRLRRLDITDAKKIQRLAGDERVSRFALNIPYPFQNGIAEEWIASIEEDSAILAIERAETNEFIGVVGLTVTRSAAKAELAYWIGHDYWRQGFATEAAQAMIDFSFKNLDLNRIYASCLSRNHTSSTILLKIGMRYEGWLRQDTLHRGMFEDIELYGILRSDYQKNFLAPIREGAAIPVKNFL